MMHVEMDVQQKPSVNRIWVLALFACILIIRLLMVIISDSNLFPINHLKIEASYKNITRSEIQNIISPYMQKSFLTFSVRNVEDDFKNNSWVESISIEKKWPDSINIKIIERIPVAIYNNMILSEKADLFKAKDMKKLSYLPHFIGPKNQQKDILQIYEKLSKLLVSKGLFITSMWLRDNQACEIILQNGVKLRLGKQNIEERLLRFIQVYPKLFAKRFDQISAIDLRYASGIAVDWKKQPDQISNNPNNMMGQ